MKGLKCLGQVPDQRYYNRTGRQKYEYQLGDQLPVIIVYATDKADARRQAAAYFRERATKRAA